MELARVARHHYHNLGDAVLPLLQACCPSPKPAASPSSAPPPSPSHAPSLLPPRVRPNPHSHMHRLSLPSRAPSPPPSCTGSRPPLRACPLLYTRALIYMRGLSFTHVGSPCACTPVYKTCQPVVRVRVGDRSTKCDPRCAIPYIPVTLE